MALAAAAMAAAMAAVAAAVAAAAAKAALAVERGRRRRVCARQRVCVVSARAQLRRGTRGRFPLRQRRGGGVGQNRRT